MEKTSLALLGIVAAIAIAGLVVTSSGNPSGAVTAMEFTPCSQVPSQCGGQPHPVSTIFAFGNAGSGEWVFSSDSASPSGICGERCMSTGQLDCSNDPYVCNQPGTCIRCDPETEVFCGTDGACTDCDGDGHCA